MTIEIIFCWDVARRPLGSKCALIENHHDLNFHTSFCYLHLLPNCKYDLLENNVCYWTDYIYIYIHIQFSLLSCLTICYYIDCSMSGFPVHHPHQEIGQTHVNRVGDAIQPSHPLLSPSLHAFNLSQHQGLFQWVSYLHQVAKVLELQLQYQSFQWIFRIDFLLSFPNFLVYSEHHFFYSIIFRIWNNSAGIPSLPLALFITIFLRFTWLPTPGCLTLDEWSYHLGYLGH